MQLLLCVTIVLITAGVVSAITTHRNTQHPLSLSRSFLERLQSCGTHLVLTPPLRPTHEKAHADINAATACSATFNSAVSTSSTAGAQCTAVLAYAACLDTALVGVDPALGNIFLSTLRQWNATLMSAGVVCSVQVQQPMAEPRLETFGGNIRVSTPNDLIIETAS